MYIDAILPKDAMSTQVLSMADDAAQMSARSAREARIAELEAELENIRKQRKNFDVEEEMGKYKFVYDADPSSYMTTLQNKRNAAATDALRKDTKAASDASTLQSAWKQNAIDLDVARYDLQSATTAYNTAKASGDEAGMERAYNDMARARAGLNRATRENESLRKRVSATLGLDLDLSDSESKADRKNLDDDLADVQSLKQLDNTINELESLVAVDNVPISQEEKDKRVSDGTAKIESAKDMINRSSLSQDSKNEKLQRVRDVEAKLRNFGKKQSKGGQGVTLTPEQIKSAAEKEIFEADGKLKNPLKLAALGAAKLRKYQKEYGWDLKNAIDYADRKGVK